VKQKPVIVGIHPKLLALIDAQAEAEFMNRADFIRRVLFIYLQRNGNDETNLSLDSSFLRPGNTMPRKHQRHSLPPNNGDVPRSEESSPQDQPSDNFDWKES
jgi:hypothetical protein